tara:strand:+ start:479 stop:1405 length:927 start_codon:yes stop_codon:yes gene_type:complete
MNYFHTIKLIKIVICFTSFTLLFSQGMPLSEINFKEENIIIGEPNPRAHYFSMAVQGGIILAGAIFWNYSERWTGEFGIENEGWFGKESNNGGADKLGHAYTWCLLTRGLIHNYERHGFSRKSSAFWGFTIPAFNGIIIEILDGYTDYNASTEDILFNLMGSGLGAYLYLNPKLDELIHLDWSYLPSSDFTKNIKKDFTTDYAGQVFTLEINGKGVRKILKYDQSSPIDYFQMGFSYYTRGYSGELNTNKERFTGITLGINLQEFFKVGSPTRTFVKYFKIPYSFTGIFRELNTNQTEMQTGNRIFNY